jgi:hypothetical protein
MNQGSYFCHLLFIASIFSVVLSGCNSNSEKPKPPSQLLEENSFEGPETGPGIQLTDGRNAEFHSEWIIGAWRDEFSSQTVFTFDTGFLRYPDKEEMYPYEVDSTKIQIDLGSDGILSGEIDMPSDSVLILIFESEMAIFYRTE